MLHRPPYFPYYHLPIFVRLLFKGRVGTYSYRTRESGLLFLYIFKSDVFCFAVVFTSLRIQWTTFVEQGWLGYFQAFQVVDPCMPLCYLMATGSKSALIHDIMVPERFQGWYTTTEDDHEVLCSTPYHKIIRIP